MIIVAAFALWGGYQYWFVQRPLLAADATARSHVAAQLAAQRGLAVHLQHEIVALHTDSYIATLAAQRYNLVKPGEILFSAAGTTNKGGR